MNLPLAERLRAAETDRYVAFLDLLGFSHLVRTHWYSAASTCGTIVRRRIDALSDQDVVMRTRPIPATHAL